MTKEARDALAGTNEVEITVTGRKSGRQISHPVWFVQEEENLYLVPVTGSDSQWFKNVRKTPVIRVAANGMALNSSATPITEPTRVDRIVDKFRDKYGAEAVTNLYPKHDVAVQVPLG